MSSALVFRLVAVRVAVVGLVVVADVDVAFADLVEDAVAVSFPALVLALAASFAAALARVIRLGGLAASIVHQSEEIVAIRSMRDA